MSTIFYQDDDVLRVEQLHITVKKKNRVIRTIVKDIGFRIKKGETLAIVGESGSGKSVTSLAILGLLPKSLCIQSGSIFFQHKNIVSMTEKERKKFRGKGIGYVFQDYRGSFTPFFKIGKQMTEVIKTHERCSQKEAKEKVLDALDKVDLPSTRIWNSYPFELSGGQLQRTALATAMILKPSLLIADEPTTALDVCTVQKIMDHITKLKEENDCSFLLITHDIGLALQRADWIAVMYGGRILELAKASQLRQHSYHPYTKLLLQSRPSITKHKDTLVTIPGEPGLIYENGCPFALRCPIKEPVCLKEPLKRTSINNDHDITCHVAQAHLIKESVISI
ncbi:MAG: ABC transporter ATP-binding protein [Bacillus sp. (in: Bacteria)]|nr:ABC transporter ATP-binding protein [Bacillus sp. (in: firmicutes)]